MSVSSNIPITVFTGFLGAGKTSIILSLLPQLPKDYRVVLLKNELGDIEVDSQLAKQSSLMAVSEILNGCMCCVLVGQMKTALLEIREKYRPDRIIIECSGSAFPATLAFQIRELERETGDLKLDAIVTVIDAENFAGYEDTSPTAKMQASYTDVILINKWEHLSARALDFVVDHLNTLNDQTPKINCKSRNGVDPNLIFGVDSKLFLVPGVPGNDNIAHNDEVETITVYRGPSKDRPHAHEHHHDASRNLEDIGGGESLNDGASRTDIIDKADFAKALECLSKESIWRVKGFVTLNDGVHILNWAFGRFDLTRVEGGTGDNTACVRFTVMGGRGEVKRASRRFVATLQADILY